MKVGIIQSICEARPYTVFIASEIVELKLYVKDVGVEVPGGGVRVGQEVPESLQGDLAELSVVLASREGAETNILKLKVRILLLLLPLSVLTTQPGM